MVFCLPDHDEWQAACDCPGSCGFGAVSSLNPYSEVSGGMFEDAYGAIGLFYRMPLGVLRRLGPPEDQLI